MPAKKIPSTGNGNLLNSMQEDARSMNEENLCDIYTEAGKKMLCKTCTRYPRHYEEYENLREISLSLSCPGCCENDSGQQ